ncbi:hypothetical protein O1W69_05075 [Chlamydia sp. 12-01]|uniref:hypothetical protein n=1 Tax=Chlamydia sp. 12-01 TaxID=3002742 RepID=UPI0035D478BD
MFTTYLTNFDFKENTANHPNLLKTAYVRSSMTINSHTECLFIDSKDNLISTLLNVVPILGTIRGMARLYSIYAVKDRSEDKTSDIIVHTITGILEILGLGILLFIAKIIILAMGILFFTIGTKTGLIKENF